jgi:hypothetical protein
MYYWGLAPTVYTMQAPSLSHDANQFSGSHSPSNHVLHVVQLSLERNPDDCPGLNPRTIRKQCFCFPLSESAPYYLPINFSTCSGLPLLPPLQGCNIQTYKYRQGLTLGQQTTNHQCMIRLVLQFSNAYYIMLHIQRQLAIIGNRQ